MSPVPEEKGATVKTCDALEQNLHFTAPLRGRRERKIRNEAEPRKKGGEGVLRLRFNFSLPYLDLIGNK